MYITDEPTLATFELLFTHKDNILKTGNLEFFFRHLIYLLDHETPKKGLAIWFDKIEPEVPSP